MGRLVSGGVGRASEQVEDSVSKADSHFLQPKISGYRQLSEEDAARINEIKTFGETIGVFIDTMRTNPDFDQRWVSIGQTDLQKGIMALVRAVAKPTGF